MRVEEGWGVGVFALAGGGRGGSGPPTEIRQFLAPNAPKIFFRPKWPTKHINQWRWRKVFSDDLEWEGGGVWTRGGGCSLKNGGSDAPLPRGLN